MIARAARFLPMPTSSKRYKKRAGCRSEASTKVGCTLLMVVDQEPFLKKALSTCKRLRKELHSKQALLNDFEELDRSAFQQWMNRTQGKTLTQIRELREEANAFQFILHHLSHCAYHNYEAVPELFEELFERKENGTLFSYVPPKQPDPFGFDEDSDDDAEEEDDWDEEDDDWGDDEDEDEEDMRDFFDRMFGGGSGGRASEGPSAQKAANDNARLKTCYRNLAKRLHPDHSDLEESIREKRWHEIQEAYQNNDLEALVRVEAICDMDDTGLSAKLGLARLNDLAAYHQSHLRPIRDALRAAKQDIAFGFAKKGPSGNVKRHVTTDLKEERMEVKDMVGQMKRSANAIRDEVAAQLRANAAAVERTLRREAGRKGKKANYGKKPVPEAKASTKPVAEGLDQMTFF